MTGRGTHTRTFLRAAETAGGLDQLAEELGATPEDLRRWLDGSSEPPVDAFVRALDIVAKGALHPNAERRRSPALGKSRGPLSMVAAIEELLRAPQIGGNVEKAVKLAMSLARSAPSGAVSSLAMQVVIEANRLGRSPGTPRADDRRLDEALSRLRVALTQHENGS